MTMNTAELDERSTLGTLARSAEKAEQRRRQLFLVDQNGQRKPGIVLGEGAREALLRKAGRASQRVDVARDRRERLGSSRGGSGERRVQDRKRTLDDLGGVLRERFVVRQKVEQSAELFLIGFGRGHFEQIEGARHARTA